MIEKNKPLYHLINLLTYGLFVLSRKRRKEERSSILAAQPIWVTGLFRSGTSLATQILSELGVDLGPKEHLLQAKGSRKVLNPDGFQENYLFMDWSLKVFRDLNGWGHQPPSQEDIRRYSPELDDKEFAYHSIVEIHDDRISNINKLKALRKYGPSNFEAYLAEQFTGPFAIKNPHFSILFPLLQKRWAKSTFVVVFRNPKDTINSAKKVVPTADFELFFEYYTRLLESDLKMIYFSYDELIKDPKESIVELAKVLNLETSNVDKVVKLVDVNRSSHKKLSEGNWPQKVVTLYNEMNQRAINSK